MDQDLVVRVQHGDQRAFEALAAADHPRLYRVAYGILRDHQSAEDATQQALLCIWRDIRRLREPAKYEGWSYRLLVHACGREARRTPEWLPDEAIPPERQPLSADEYNAVLDRDELERGFQRLSVEHRAVVVLRYLLDLAPERIAEVLGIPRRTVYSRLKRAMPAMRAALDADAREVAPARGRKEVLR
jgi:RNA polymerase sigma-70 factor (ECF subfamily)